MSDHNGIRYVFNQPSLNAWQSRWLATLNEFDFEIKCIKGKENRVADALSRIVHVNHIATMSSYGTYLQECIFHVGKQDDKFSS